MHIRLASRRNGITRVTAITSQLQWTLCSSLKQGYGLQHINENRISRFLNTGGTNGTNGSNHDNGDDNGHGRGNDNRLWSSKLFRQRLLRVSSWGIGISAVLPVIGTHFMAPLDGKQGIDLRHRSYGFFNPATDADADINTNDSAADAETNTTITTGHPPHVEWRVDFYDTNGKSLGGDAYVRDVTRDIVPIYEFVPKDSTATYEFNDGKSVWRVKNIKTMIFHEESLSGSSKARNRKGLLVKFVDGSTKEMANGATTISVRRCPLSTMDDKGSLVSTPPLNAKLFWRNGFNDDMPNNVPTIVFTLGA